jgi:hypothetical protein
MKSNIALNSNVSLEERTNHCFDALIAESFVRSKSRKCQRLRSPIRQILSAICNCLPHQGVEACTETALSECGPQNVCRVAAPSRVSKGRRVWFFLSNEFVSRGTQEKSKPRPFKAERVGHPERLNQFLGVDVLEWCHPTVRVCQFKTRERVGHPPFCCKWIS